MGSCCGGEENAGNMNTKKPGAKQPAARPKNTTTGGYTAAAR